MFTVIYYIIEYLLKQVLLHFTWYRQKNSPSIHKRTLNEPLKKTFEWKVNLWQPRQTIWLCYGKRFKSLFPSETFTRHSLSVQIKRENDQASFSGLKFFRCLQKKPNSFLKLLWRCWKKVTNSKRQHQCA